MEVIEFPLSKRKVFVNTGLLLSIVCLGVFIIYISILPHFNLYSFPSLAEILFYTAVLGFAATQCLRWLLTSKIGLRIDKNGITDNSTSSRIGFIPWSDIQIIEISEEGNVPMILVFVKNSEAYFSRANKIKKVALRANDDRYDTPFVIRVTSLDCTFFELENAIKIYFDKMAGSKLDK